MINNRLFLVFNIISAVFFVIIIFVIYDINEIMVWVDAQWKKGAYVNVPSYIEIHTLVLWAVGIIGTTLSLISIAIVMKEKQ